MDRNKKKVIKLGVVGNSGAGKTTLIYRIAKNKFFENTMAGKGIDFEAVKNYNFREQIMDLNIFDIAGLGRNNDLVISFIKDAQALLLVFDLVLLFGQNISLLNSFAPEGKNDFDEQFELWYQKIIDRAKYNVPVLVVGTKSDKVDLKDTQLLDKIDKILDDLQAKKAINLIKSKDRNFHIISSYNGDGVPQLVDLWVEKALIFEPISEPKQESIILKAKNEDKDEVIKLKKKSNCC